MMTRKKLEKKEARVLINRTVYQFTITSTFALLLNFIIIEFFCQINKKKKKLNTKTGKLYR